MIGSRRLRIIRATACVAIGLTVGPPIGAQGAGPSSVGSQASLHLEFHGTDRVRQWVDAVHALVRAGVVTTRLVPSLGRTYCAIYRDRFQLPGCPASLGRLAEEINGVAARRLPTDAVVRLPALQTRPEPVMRPFQLETAKEQQALRRFAGDGRVAVAVTGDTDGSGRAMAMVEWPGLTVVIPDLDAAAVDRAHQILAPLAAGAVTIQVRRPAAPGIGTPPMAQESHATVAAPTPTRDPSPSLLTSLDFVAGPSLPRAAAMAMAAPRPAQTAVLALAPALAAERPAAEMPGGETVVTGSVAPVSGAATGNRVATNPADDVGFGIEVPAVFLAATALAVSGSVGLIPGILVFLGGALCLFGASMPLLGGGTDPLLSVTPLQGMGLVLVLLVPWARSGWRRIVDALATPSWLHGVRVSVALWLAPDLHRSRHRGAGAAGTPSQLLRAGMGVGVRLRPVAVPDPETPVLAAEPVARSESLVSVLGHRHGLEDLVTLRPGPAPVAKTGPR